MTIIKQLWLGIFFLLLSALLLSGVVAMWSMKQYLEGEIQMKNMDNATSLALSMSQIDKDLVTLELLLMAQFDTGHYQRIALLDPEKNLLFERVASQGQQERVPKVFARLVHFDIEPGSAFVQDGWQQFATLELESSLQFALESLWRLSQILIFAFFALLTVAGVVGTLLVHWLLRPLGDVVAQAEAFGRRQYILAKEPQTHEFRLLVTSMNRLASRMRLNFEQDQQQLTQLQHQLWFDEVTGLYQRQYFFQQFDRLWADSEEQVQAVLMICRLEGLNQLNQLMGRKQVDNLLQRLSQALKIVGEASIAGRLNGSDFVLLVTSRQSVAQSFEHQLQAPVKAILQVVEQVNQPCLQLNFASAEFDHGWSRGQLLTHLDQVLAQAVVQGFGVWQHTDAQAKPEQVDLQQLRPKLVKALAGGLDLTFLDVGLGTPFHHQRLRVYLRIGSEVKPLHQLLSAIKRLGLMVELDRTLTEQVQVVIDKSANTLVLPISTDGFLDAAFISSVIDKVESQSRFRNRVVLECPEWILIQKPKEMMAIIKLVKSHGGKFALSSVGFELAKIEDLLSLGLDYLWMEPSLHDDLPQSAQQQIMVKQICALGEKMHAVVVASASAADEQLLLSLGVNAVLKID